MTLIAGLYSCDGALGELVSLAGTDLLRVFQEAKGVKCEMGFKASDLLYGISTSLYQFCF